MVDEVRYSRGPFSFAWHFLAGTFLGYLLGQLQEMSSNPSAELDLVIVNVRQYYGKHIRVITTSWEDDLDLCLVNVDQSMSESVHGFLVEAEGDGCHCSQPGRRCLGSLVRFFEAEMLSKLRSVLKLGDSDT